jgi:hypothetical protein
MCHGMPWSKNVKNTMYVAGRGYTKSLEECDQSNAVLELVALAKLRNFAWDGSGFLDKPKFQPVLTV